VAGGCGRRGLQKKKKRDYWESAVTSQGKRASREKLGFNGRGGGFPDEKKLGSLKKRRSGCAEKRLARTCIFMGKKGRGCTRVRIT